MNKKTIRIAGWALGLSMAVAGIGAAIGAPTKNPIEANAAGTTVTKTMSEIATANSWTTASGNGTQPCYTSFNLDSNVLISTTGSANCGSFWGSDWRLYQAQSGTFVVTPQNGVEISSLTITFTVSNAGCLSTTSGTKKTAYFTSGTAKAVTLSSATTYYVANTGTNNNGQVRITAISATYSVPQSISLALQGESKSSILSGETTTLIATPAGGLTGNYSWSSSVSGIVTFDNADKNEMTFTGVNEGTTTITVSLDGKNDTFDITVSRKLNGLTITSAPTKTVYTEGEDFDSTGLIVTANFLGADPAVISNTNLVFSPSTNLSSSVDEIEISYTENEVTKTVVQAITVNAPEYTLKSLSWSASDINAYEGDTLTAEDVVEFAVHASWEEDVPDSALDLGVYSLFIGDDEITSADLPFTWSTSHSGKNLRASYTNNGITKTASVNVTVIERLNKVFNIVDGDSRKVDFIVGTDTDETTITKGDLTATLTTMDNASYYQIYANQSGTFSVASGKGLITKIEFTCTASGTAKYGPGNASAEVGTYSYSGTKGTWTGSAAEVVISTTAQIRMSSLSITYTPKEENIYSNKHYAAQKAVLEFATYFNETMDCDGLYGNTSNVASKWSAISTAFGTKRTESGDAENYNNMLKYASAVENGDSLQSMLARYNYIVAKYKVTDFLHENADRPEVAEAGIVNSIDRSLNFTDSNLPLIITLVSGGVLLTGGAFLFTRRRRNED